MLESEEKPLWQCLLGKKKTKNSRTSLLAGALPAGAVSAFSSPAANGSATAAV